MGKSRQIGIIIYAQRDAAAATAINDCDVRLVGRCTNRFPVILSVGGMGGGVHEFRFVSVIGV